jgi:hypothetical protein
VTKEGHTVYTLVENIPAYCIFSGNGPCNEWVFEDGVYKWTSGGAPVEPGQYTVNVDVSLNGKNTNWRVDFTVALPWHEPISFIRRLSVLGGMKPLQFFAPNHRGGVRAIREKFKNSWLRF